MKKGSSRTAMIFLLVAFLVVLATASLVANTWSDDKITGQTIRVENNNAIRVPDSDQALPNTDQGTVVLWTKPPVKVFDQFDDARDYIIFFSATNVPGVRIAYNLKTHRFEAGTPLLTTPEIDIFDEQPHQLAYTYKVGAIQALFIDGIRVNSSDFKPLKISDVTGRAYRIKSIPETDIEGIEVAMYDREIDENILNKI